MATVDKADEQSIAHQLLVELLAHQFAFPVRWIDTQDALFTNSKNVSRFVELGPSSVLATMARRTRELKHSMRDTFLGVDRSFMASTRDQKKLHFHYDALDDSTENKYSRNPTTSVPAPTGESTEQHVEVSAGLAVETVLDVPEVNVTVLERIQAVVAFKLKKGLDAVVANKSIKEISAGRSTLQNELIGDLLSEFGSTPDGAEDMALTTLATALDSPGQKPLGPELTALTSKFVAASMPMGLNMKEVRSYLSTSWGLGPMRQSSVLLHAMSEMNGSSNKRYESPKDAKDALDHAALQYAQSCGLSLMKRVPGSGSSSLSARVSVDPAVLEKVSRDARALAHKQHRALGAYLGLSSIDETVSRLSEFTQLHQSHQERLDAWAAELDADFETGIKPIFRSKHIRRFNFWWNQNRVNTMRLYHDAVRGSPVLQKQIEAIANRADRSSIALAKALCQEARRCSGNTRVSGEMDRLLLRLEAAHQQPPVARFSWTCMRPRTMISIDGRMEYTEVPRYEPGDSRSYRDYLELGPCREKKGSTSCLTKRNSEWSHDAELSFEVLASISQGFIDGISFSGRKVLITGAGPGSIAAEVVRNLLEGGATVIVTTSRSITDAQGFFRDMYAKTAAKGAELRVVPFNQGSVADCKALVDYVYDEPSIGNIDAVIPFAAISERGFEVDAIGGKSELAHRVMLINVIRLIGFIVQRKKEMKVGLPPTQLLLPFSPNHGIFGGDGLYSESKLGLESLLERWHSESWKELVTICGVIIGWTRGTGLMEANDMVSEMIESHGVLTFSRQEMALNISVLLTPAISQRCERESIIADFGGGLQKLRQCKELIAQHRADMAQTSNIRKAICNQDAKERSVGSPQRLMSGLEGSSVQTDNLTSMRIEFPDLPDYDKTVAPLSSIEGMVDLSNTVVIVGYSELGPWGSARTRWQMESQGRLAQSGYIELAWMMGLIKRAPRGGPHIGWIDSGTGAPVYDSQVEAKYGDQILERAGIRMIEADLRASVDPKQKEYLHEVALEDDMPEFEVDQSVADALRLKHGDNVAFTTPPDSEQVRIKLRAGTRIMVPKTAPFLSSLVAGLLPTGWDALKYGVSEEIVRQVDPVTLFTLCCVSEAFYSAGITDPTEVFKYIHLSEMGIFLGSSMGGTEKTREMYRDVYLDKQVQSDIIQETYLNTPAAWINMLLLGGTGPIKTPVGACATGVESIDIGLESIASGKTKMCLVGGFDNFHQDESFGFSMMKATVNTVNEFDAARTPAEMSRPTSESRAGFVESQGAGVQILCSAELALDMGLPIYGIIAGSAMAADGFGRSVPAPGQGVLTFAREAAQARHSRILDVEYRRSQMQQAMLDVVIRSNGSLSPKGYVDIPTPETESEASTPNFKTISDELDDEILIARTKAIRRQWGNELRQLDPTIAPMRAGLAVWGLTIDDITVASLHGTSTKANDSNEAKVLTAQMDHLHRDGPPLLAICQKSITGHPKAPAASWMLNGALQVLNTGLVPGNLKADNVDPALKQFHHLVYPTEPIQTESVKAFLLTSFGFGQKGGQVVGVAPRYLFATLPEESYLQYADTCRARQRIAQQAFAQAIINGTLCKLQPAIPHPASKLLKASHEVATQNSLRQGRGNSGLDAQLLRAQLTRLLGTASPATTPSDYTDDSDDEAQLSLDTPPRYWIEQMVRAHPQDRIFRVGIDGEDIEGFASDNSPMFVERNFSPAERAYIETNPDPHSAFVGRWCAKEAVFKSLGARSKGAGAAMKDIEILSIEGAPKVNLRGDALQMAIDSNVSEVLVSITYDKRRAVAIALSMRRNENLRWKSESRSRSR